MAKKLDITPAIAALIASATDGSTDPSTVSVYEAISINSLPVNKTNIFEGAVHPENTLRQMADYVAKRPATNHVPVHTNHDQGYGMPVGKVFHAEFVQGTNGVGEVRSLFFVGNNEADTVAKLEAGSIEEVSVGLRYQHLNCSQCGWDYLGADATMMNFLDRMCANEHAIGTDGVHLVLNGLDRWMEQSLVSLGAAQGAKIVARTKSLLGNESYTALAASGIDPSASTLYATLTLPKETDTMEMKDLIKDLTDAKALVLSKDVELGTLTASVAASQATLAELQASVTTLTAANAAYVASDAAKIAADRTAAFAFIREEADRLCIASGVEKVKSEATLDELKASITANRTKLTASIPAGGRSEESSAGSSKSVSDVAGNSHAASFSTK
jgi:hypothetical protein